MQTMDDIRAAARDEAERRGKAPLYFEAVELFVAANGVEPGAVEVRALVSDRIVGGVEYGPEPVRLPLDHFAGPPEIEALFADPLVSARLVTGQP